MGKPSSLSAGHWNSIELSGKRIMVSLFSAAKRDHQIGVDFLPAGVAVVRVQTGKK